MGTFLSVVYGSIVTVPIRDVARDLGVSIGAASLVITAMSLSFGALMPLGGWVGNRFGRRNVYCVGTAVLTLTGIAASFAPNLTVLVALRFVQGSASATVTPIVIAILAELYPPGERARALAGWALANGLGQALGPPLGGVIASVFGWRATFLAPAVFGLIATVAAWRYVPADPGRRVPLEWRGAAALTVGALLISSAVAGMPQTGLASAAFIVPIALGAAFVVLFVVTTRRAEHPFVSPAIFSEPSFVRSSLAVFTGTFLLGATGLGIPLYLTHALEMPIALAGFVSLALPVAMVFSARPSSGFVHRTSSTAGMRVGLAAAIVTGSALALATTLRIPIPALMAVVFVTGVGLSFIHTSCAVGSTATAASRYGAGVGLFNLIRVVGTSLGTAWIALIVQNTNDAYGLAFGGAAVVAAVGLAATFAVPPDRA
jgi:MFS family permease